MADLDTHIRAVLDARTPFDGSKLVDRQIVHNAAIAFACKVLSEENPERSRRNAARHALDAILDWRFRDAVGTLIEAHRE
jgi:hypothetical protein